LVNRGNELIRFYEALLARFGPQGWWPGEDGFEVMVGAVLTQNTNWANVEKAIANLKKENLLNPAALNDISREKLAQLIRPAGYFNVKAKRLKNLIGWFCREYEGSVEVLAQGNVSCLREELLSVNGIGRETADSIILYALGKPTFVVDTYTYRILVRHGCIDMESDYEQIKEYCEGHLSQEVALYNEFHALIVRVGKEYCRPKPRCAGCPLEQFEHCIEENP
jgi:endonuclease-3 related protein